MPEPRFLQIHTLHSYTAALLNRDDSGLAKRLPYGGVMRTRISSQCLKRHWRFADDPHGLDRIDGATAAYRSRELVTIKIGEELRNDKQLRSEIDKELRSAGITDNIISAGLAGDIISALEPEFQKAIYGNKADQGKKNRQTLLFGEPEIKWLQGEARRLAQGATSVDDVRETVKNWAKEFRPNIKSMREATMLPAGLSAALFGRMVTSDPEANIDAPVHVAHAFTVHGEETESDYFTAVDDLKRDEDDGGADTIQETELTSGLYYGYTVIDVPGLISNTTGFEREEWSSADRRIAADVIHNLAYLIAEVSPGAKLGSTAPYGRAELLLAEFGDRQPRSLAGAFRTPVSTPAVHLAQTALARHLSEMDGNYETGEARRVLHFGNEDMPGAQRGSLREIASWARDVVRKGAIM